MIRAVALLTVIFAAAASTALATAEMPSWIDREWAEGRAWNQGASEICTYDATTTLNGRPCPYEMVTVITKRWVSDTNHAELDFPIAQDLPVATAAAGAARRAWRFNMISDRIDTQTTEPGRVAYPYDYATALYLDAANPSLCLSSIATSHEWTGLTVKRFRGWGDKPSLETFATRNSGPADQEQPVEAGAIPMEAVPFLVRMMKFDQPTTATFRCLPTFMVNRSPDAKIMELNAIADGVDVTTTTAGAFECNKVKVLTADSKPVMNLWIEKPGTLRRLIYKTTVTGKIFALRNSRMEALVEADTR